MDKIAAINNIIDIQKLFPRSFAVYGTALGCLREGNIIDHDKDTDIGILFRDFTWEQVSHAIRRGRFSIISIFGSYPYGMEIAFRRNGVKTDLMLYYENGDKFFNVLWNNGGRNGSSDAIVHEYPSFMFDVEKGFLDDFEIRTLGEQYIEHVYGTKWRTPVKEWNWRTDHKCIKK